MNREKFTEEQIAACNFHLLTCLEDIYIDEDYDDDDLLLFEVVDSTVDSYD